MSRLRAQWHALSPFPKQSPPDAAGPHLDARACTRPCTLLAGFGVHPADAGEGREQTKSSGQSHLFHALEPPSGIKRTVWKFAFPKYKECKRRRLVYQERCVQSKTGTALQRPTRRRQALLT